MTEQTTRDTIAEALCWERIRHQLKDQRPADLSGWVTRDEYTLADALLPLWTAYGNDREQRGRDAVTAAVETVLDGPNGQTGNEAGLAMGSPGWDSANTRANFGRQIRKVLGDSAGAADRLRDEGWQAAVAAVYEGRAAEAVGEGPAGFPRSPYRTPQKEQA